MGWEKEGKKKKKARCSKLKPISGKSEKLATFLDEIDEAVGMLNLMRDQERTRTYVWYRGEVGTAPVNTACQEEDLCGQNLLLIRVNLESKSDVWKIQNTNKQKKQMTTEQVATRNVPSRPTWRRRWLFVLLCHTRYAVFKHTYYSPIHFVQQQSTVVTRTTLGIMVDRTEYCRKT